ncbi:NBS-containing resistance-like protein, partial [Trifolium medium]|nr:NBS-containing resistance-like protein [Trifolium medium]
GRVIYITGLGVTADIKDELETIQGFLKDADKRTEGDNTSEGVKTWVKQVKEVSFRIEDIIDDYLIQMIQQCRVPGCASLLHKLKTMIPHRQVICSWDLGKK